MKAAEELRYLVLAAQREGNRLLAQSLRPLDLTPSQAEVLRILEDHGPLTMSALGDLLVCETGNNPSRLVDRLVSKGAVDRRHSQEDRREVELMLSTVGKQLAQQVQQIEDVINLRIDDALGGQNVEATLNLLRRFVADLPAGKALTRRIGRGTSSHGTDRSDSSTSATTDPDRTRRELTKTEEENEIERSRT
ncbi:MAG: MarR family winged helix-turn-helix transcriptional regulator [Bacilli bacterium]